MADKDLNDKKQYDAINPDSIIKVEISARYFADLRAMFMSLLIKDRNKKQIAETFNRLRENKVQDENEYQLYILLHILENIERSAKEQGAIIKQHVPDLTKDFQD